MDGARCSITPQVSPLSPTITLHCCYFPPQNPPTTSPQASLHLSRLSLQFCMVLPPPNTPSCNDSMTYSCAPDLLRNVQLSRTLSLLFKILFDVFICTRILFKRCPGPARFYGPLGLLGFTVLDEHSCVLYQATRFNRLCPQQNPPPPPALTLQQCLQPLSEHLCKPPVHLQSNHCHEALRSSLHPSPPITTSCTQG